ncbi:MAG: pyrroline-5-carboxylate reductase [Firmicutes bacterium]|nr:pyrroline-5-carboxylate reductase [Bacillota bacterium]
MATAMIKGLLQQGYPAQEILVSDPDPERRESLAEFGVLTFTDNQEMLWELRRREGEGVVLAVKPQVIKEALAGLTFPLLPVLSIVAGYSLAALARLLPAEMRILRAMPNTPALVGAGITALTASVKCGVEDQKWAEKVLGSLGKVVIVPESLMNAVTGLSGSGPGFVYFMLEALIDGGVLAGLPRPLARELAVQTAAGSIKMLQELKEHPAELRDMVTSPGGTTIAGLVQLEAAGVSGQVMKAVLAAAEKAAEIGE